jgi:hypothetical protein
VHALEQRHLKLYDNATLFLEPTHLLTTMVLIYLFIPYFIIIFIYVVFIYSSLFSYVPQY